MYVPNDEFKRLEELVTLAEIYLEDGALRTALLRLQEARRLLIHTRAAREAAR